MKNPLSRFCFLIDDIVGLVDEFKQSIANNVIIPDQLMKFTPTNLTPRFVVFKGLLTKNLSTKEAVCFQYLQQDVNEVCGIVVRGNPIINIHNSKNGLFYLGSAEVLNEDLDPIPLGLFGGLQYFVNIPVYPQTINTIFRNTYGAVEIPFKTDIDKKREELAKLETNITEYVMFTFSRLDKYFKGRLFKCKSSGILLPRKNVQEVNAILRHRLSKKFRRNKEDEIIGYTHTQLEEYWVNPMLYIFDYPKESCNGYSEICNLLNIQSNLSDMGTIDIPNLYIEIEQR